MAFTKPKGEQLEFRSSRTGFHNLDAYLEACEKGDITLPALLDKLFTEQGGLNPTALQFRVNEETSTLQSRFTDNTLDPEAGWFDTNQKFFRQRGRFAPSTQYERLDMLEDDDKVFICVTSHTSGPTLDQSKFSMVFDGNKILAEVQAFRQESEPRLDLLEEYVLLRIDVL